MSAVIITSTGQYVDLLNPKPETIKVRDIAHHLSLTYRFNGATVYGYSVAQHSIYVSKIVDPEFAFVALLHDATEAYLGDMVSPLKRCLDEYRTIEKNMWRVMAKLFDVPYGLPNEVRVADLQAYMKERICLIDTPYQNDPVENQVDPLQVPSLPIDEWKEPGRVENEFINRYLDLLRDRL